MSIPFFRDKTTCQKQKEAVVLLAASFYIFKNDLPFEIGEGMSYSNLYAKEFSDRNFWEKIEGLSELFADGSVPNNEYKKIGDHVFHDGVDIAGVTQYLGFKKHSSNVYLFRVAFTSKEQLYLVMGHEYIHCGFNFHHSFDNASQEAAAYDWTYKQAQLWNIKGSEIFKINYDMVSEFANPYYDYKFLEFPLINIKPL